MNTPRNGLPLVVALVGIGLSALIGHTMYGQAHRPPSKALSTARPPAPEANASFSTPASRSDLWRTIRPDMFSHAVPVLPVPSLPAALPARTAPVPAAITLANDPLADYVYNGTVMVDGEMSALIEHRKSRQGWYVSEGDTWQSYRVLAVDEHQVTVEVNGESHTLTKSDDINVVPLASNAGQSASAAAAVASLSAYQTAVDNPVQISLVSYLGDAISQSLSGIETSNLKISLDNAQIRVNQDTSSNLGTIYYTSDAVKN